MFTNVHITKGGRHLVNTPVGWWWRSVGWSSSVKSHPWNVQTFPVGKTLLVQLKHEFWLVVNGCHEFYFPRNIGFLIIPIDSYFSEGFKPPTSNLFEVSGICRWVMLKLWQNYSRVLREIPLEFTLEYIGNISLATKSRYFTRTSLELIQWYFTKNACVWEFSQSCFHAKMVKMPRIHYIESLLQRSKTRGINLKAKIKRKKQRKKIEGKNHHFPPWKAHICSS